MKQKTRYITTLCLVVSLIFTQFTSLYACSARIIYNHWYQIDYDIQNESLPMDVTATIVGTETQNVWTTEEPPIDPGYPVNAGYQIHPDLDGAPRLRFTNTGSNTIYLNSLSDNAVEPDDTVDYDIRREIALPERNPQSAGGVTEPPPPPFLQEFFITHDAERFTIPITVTYSLNPFYDENLVGRYAPLDDYLNVTDTIVLGEVITVAADAATRESTSSVYVVGYARIKVEKYLLGDGPEEIEIGPFGDMCGFGIEVGRRGYFLLTTPEDTASIRYELKYASIGAPRGIFNANSENGSMIEATIQALGNSAPQTIDNTTSISLSDEPVYSLFLPYISR